MKLDYPKEWFEQSAAIEGDAEISAGLPPAYRSPHESPEELLPSIDLGHFVSLWRRSRGWDQRNLAQESRLPTQEIARVEREGVACDETLVALAELSGVSLLRLEDVATRSLELPTAVREASAVYLTGGGSDKDLSALEQQALDNYLAALRA